MSDNRTGNWTDERVAMLRQLYDEGLSYGQIAAAIGGITRNAAIGKASRIGLDKRGAPTVSNGRKKPRMRYTRRHPFHRAAPVPIVAQELEPETLPNPVTLGELKPHHCRWIDGEVKGAETLYCGAGALKGHAYCGKHYRMAHTQPRAVDRGAFELRTRKMARARNGRMG